MMIPIPRAGRLASVRGADEAAAVDGVEEVAITMHPGQAVVPLPEGWQYLGFIFARAETPAAVPADAPDGVVDWRHRRVSRQCWSRHYAPEGEDGLRLGGSRRPHVARGRELLGGARAVAPHRARTARGQHRRLRGHFAAAGI